MNNEPKPPTRSQKIFEIGLSVEAISLYLLCCGLADEKIPVSTPNIDKVWNGTGEALTRAFRDLEEWSILKKILSDREGTDIYRIMDAHEWHGPCHRVKTESA